MDEQRRPGFLDRAVEALARVATALGFNGTRLLWRWNRRRQQLGETGMRTQLLSRSVTGRHKMCRSCRALVARSARQCPECGATLAGVSSPGFGRLLANALPGAGRASSLLLLVNGFWFLMMLLAQLRLDAGPAGFSGLLRSFDSSLMIDFGSGASWLTAAGEWWRIVTPIFLHAGILHFFFNSYVLLQLGPLVESEFGSERCWVAYLLCGIAGSAGSQLLRPVNTIGASGAVMGLMGLLLVHGWRQGGATGQRLKESMLRYLIYIAVFSLLMRGIDHVNHAGGLIAGCLLGLVLPAEPARSHAAAVAWHALTLAGIALVVVAFYCVAAALGAAAPAA